MPLSEHTGSHSSAEHEQSLLHSEKSISLVDDTLCVLQSKEGLCFTLAAGVASRITSILVFWGWNTSLYVTLFWFNKALSHTRHCSVLTRCMRWWARPQECCHTWCRTAAAGGGTPWMTWRRTAELPTPDSVYTSSSAALRGRSLLPRLEGSAHLEGEKTRDTAFCFFKLWVEVLERW